MRRAAFLAHAGYAGAGLALAAAAPARAMDGEDVWNPPEPLAPAPPPSTQPVVPATLAAPIRVLLGTGGPPPQPSADGFSWNGRIYRGSAAVVPLPGGASGVINTLDIDAYLYGVVPLEISASWPAAALAAQAIVARTYTAVKRTPSQPYDVVAWTDQAYGGRTAETQATNDAVDMTSGMLVMYGGGPAAVFYMACCGGHTEDAAELWGHNVLPYLRGVPDPYCAGTPDYRWETTIGLDRFVSALGALGATLVPLQAVRPADLDPSGRPRSVLVQGATGTATVEVADLARALGPRALPSTFIRQMSLATPGVVVDGAGRGHGVGLCQWGMRNMALQGADPATIVAFYFPGTAVGLG